MSLSDRLRKLIELVTPATRRFVTLEDQTGIKAETWRTWWNRGGKASAEMIQGIGQGWPEYAFWLVTGTSDLRHGHRSPDDEDAMTRMHGTYLPRTAARDLFLKQLELARWCDENSWTIGQNDDDASYDSSIGEHTDQRAKQFSKLSSAVWMLHAVRDEQEKTLEKLQPSNHDGTIKQ
jgi:hypothetical protein